MYNVDARKILVVDDEPDLADLVSYNLKKEGFEVESAADGEEALRKVRNGNYDLLILDLMLPGIQGTEICRMLRSDTKTKHLPIIMLTAKTEEIDKIVGLEIGADDYISKPFNPRELTARVKAVLRRSGGTPVEEPSGKNIILIGDLAINKETYQVLKRDSALDLSATEFRLLLFLVEHRSRVFSRDQLLDAVWKDEAYVEPRTVDVHIRRLRMQIEDDPSNPVYIRTKRGIGYYVDADI